MDGLDSIFIPAVVAAPSRAGRSHSEAERMRRQRINGHLATLRALLPSASRMDKATLLGEVVRHVRELTRTVDDMADDVAWMVPSEGDEVGVEEAEGSDNGRFKAWVCCSDRPGLMGELSRAVGSVRARAVRAEMATVGGRTKSVLELEQRAVQDRSALLTAMRTVLVVNGPGSAHVVGERYKRPGLTARLGAA